MAIFGSLATVRAHLGQSSQFVAALAYLDEVFRPGSVANQRLLKLEEGKTERIELAGGAFALEQVYRTRTRAESLFESHRVYIDVQAIVSGEEIIEVKAIAALTVKEDRTPGQDLLFYHLTEPTSASYLRSGDAAVLYPVDGHMPCQQVGTSAQVRKTVIKVPVS